MNPSTQKMALLAIAGAMFIVVLLAFANLLSRAREAKNKNNNTEVSKEAETPLPTPIKTVRQEPTPTPTPTIEDEAIAEANKWLDKKLSPVDSNNQRCGLEKQDNVITEILRLEKLGTGTVSNGSYSTDSERRNSRLIWSGQVKFKADLFQIYLVAVENNKLKIGSPEWTDDFYFSANVSKYENGWKVEDVSKGSMYHSTSSRPIDEYSAFPCSSIITLEGQRIKVLASTPEPTKTSEPPEEQEPYTISAIEADLSVKRFFKALEDRRSNSMSLRASTSANYYNSLKSSIRNENLTVQKVLEENRPLLLKFIGIPDTKYTTCCVKAVSVNRKPYTAIIEVEVNGEFYIFSLIMEQSAYSYSSFVLVDGIKKK